MHKFKRIMSIAAAIFLMTSGGPFQGYTANAAEKCNITTAHNATLSASADRAGKVSRKIDETVPSKKANYGVKPLSKSDKEWMDKHMIKTTKVALNSMGKQRLQAEKSIKSNTANAKIAAASTSVASAQAVSASTSVPTHVDNSTLPAFPPIRSQGGIGSCASFASTYYQMSYTTNFSRGADAKNDPTDANKCSTRWTYNFANDGSDNGSNISTVYQIMTQMGVLKLSDYPYLDTTTPQTNYTAWPTDAALYKKAMNDEIDKSGYITMGDASTQTPAASPNDANLQAVKTMLANGNVLTYTSFIFSWNITTVKDDPSTTLDDSYVGQQVCRWVDSTRDGDHGMTLVGYDDNIWTDINNNGVVDPGEKGAFKIANSWGTDWGNGGFMWVAYDALNSISVVSNNPSGTARVNAFDGNTLYWMSVKPSSYSPKVTAQFTLNTAKRNQVSLNFSVIDDNGDIVKSTLTPWIFKDCGGEYSFDGTTSSDDATFIVDLTSLLDNCSTKNFQANKWGIEIGDTSADGVKLTVKDFKLVDETTSSVYTAPISMPTVLDGTSTEFWIGNSQVAAPTNLHCDSQGLTSIRLAWEPSASSSVAGYAIYSSGNKIGTSTTTCFDITNLAPSTNGTYSVRAYDSNGNYSLACNSISASTLADTEAPTAPTGLICTSKTSNSISLKWNPSTDNYKVQSYAIGRVNSSIPGSAQLIGFTTDTSYTDTTVLAGNTYTYYVLAYDGANYSSGSNNVNVKIDTNKITVYYKSSVGRNYIYYGINGVWTAAPGKLMSDSVIYPGYKEYTIDLGTDTSAKVCFNLNGGNWDNNKSLNYSLGVGRWKIDGDTNTVTQLSDFNATAPSNLAASSTTNSSVTLTWTGSEAIGNAIVGGYGIYRDGVMIGISIGATSFTDTGLSTNNTKYTYYIRALDTANNPISDASNIITVGTQVGNVVTIYYKQGYATPYIHYCPEGGSWTSVPGVRMPAAEMTGYNKITINIGTATKLQACFNDGNGSWDNNNGNNYTFSVGTYTYIPGSNKTPGTIILGAPASQTNSALSYDAGLGITNYKKAA